MREILFRGKRVRDGEWAVGDLLVNDIEGKAAIRDRSTCEVMPVIPRTVGEYTGLKDQNAKKIFEGDIISGRSDTYKVIFEDGIFLIDNSHYTTGLYVAIHMQKIDEVIGNVYDNFELLEGVKQG